MAEHAKVNLKDEVEDMAPSFGYAPDLEARFAGGPLGLEQSGISYQRLAPGFRIPFGHRHHDQEEVYVVLSGDGRLKLDDEVIEVGELDAVRIPPDRMRGLEAGTEGIEILAFGAPGKSSPQDDIAEMQPDWWSD